MIVCQLGQCPAAWPIKESVPIQHRATGGSNTLYNPVANTRQLRGDWKVHHQRTAYSTSTEVDWQERTARKDEDSHVKHKGKERRRGENRVYTEREKKVKEVVKGEKTANWQVRRRTTLLDWTGLESKTHQAEKAEWEIKINLFHQGTSKPLEPLYLFTPLSLFSYCICPRTIQLRAPRWPALFFSDDICIDSAATQPWICSLSQGDSDPLWSGSHVIINEPNRWLIIPWHPDNIQFHFQFNDRACRMACHRGIYRLIAVRTHTWAAVHDDMSKENNGWGHDRECQDVEDAWLSFHQV